MADRQSPSTSDRRSGGRRGRALVASAAGSSRDLRLCPGVPGAARRIRARPSLPLVAGQQQTPAGQKIFGAFSDCAPDRWGRTLVDRAERTLSTCRRCRTEPRRDRLSPRGPRRMRQGAFRFRDPRQRHLSARGRPASRRWSISPSCSAPPNGRTRGGGRRRHPPLLNDGSSLGGARPKAHATMREGVSRGQVPESCRRQLERHALGGGRPRTRAPAGIGVPPSQSDDRGPVRVGRGSLRRPGTASVPIRQRDVDAEAGDGGRGSYLEIAMRSRESPAPRVTAGALASGGVHDPHLQYRRPPSQSWFPARSAGWSLSPAFDLNPNPARAKS